MSSMFSNSRPYEHSPSGFDETDDFTLELDPMDNDYPSNLDWYPGHPALELSRTRQMPPLDWSPTAYDPEAHGFNQRPQKISPPLPFLHNMNVNSYSFYPGQLVNRQHSPMSGFSLSSTDSGSPTYTMSPDITPAVIPTMGSDNSFYPLPTSEPHSHEFWNPSLPTATLQNSLFSPAPKLATQTFHPRAFEFTRNPYQEDDMTEANDTVDTKMPLPQELDFDQAEHTDSGVGQSVDDDDDDDDDDCLSVDAPAEDDAGYLHDVVKHDAGTDFQPEPIRTHTSSNHPRRTYQGPVPYSKTQLQSLGVRGDNARIHKHSTSSATVNPSHTRTTSSSTAPSKVKTSSKSKKNKRGNKSSTSSAIVAALTPGIAKSRQSPLPCPFHHFGCLSVFPSKNEWKRHTLSQHLRLGYYRCNEGACALDHPSNITKIRGYNDFNRKDLFTQHCRRMHKPAEWGRKEYNEMSVRDRNKLDEWIDGIRDDCWVWRRGAPGGGPGEIIGCGFCEDEFSADEYGADEKGLRVWEARMEHVARHYEKEGRTQDEEGLDEGFLQWALDHELVASGLDDRYWLTELRGGDNNNMDSQSELGEPVRRKSKPARFPATSSAIVEGSRWSHRLRGVATRKSYDYTGDDESEDIEDTIEVHPKQLNAEMTMKGDDDDDEEEHTDTDAYGEEDVS
ncbi:uncharacterized protein HMPREF1541_08263 [Cyphellophora europaea CBS 101466]|uniref:C2H2-type domain-containing protein n=1 Tax=Cyphellophora europaea (strain CBS 101466) TaxID=1220924 RepID=W2RLB6_CYPE1|nr:uncharacterized protein HMPREF1541_08263 [Cyphellophora europaea CBS 101466]ETN37272.1 hypothetical protein HMPREF1541_08263 [Cyphellophora europaea CBS 101466]